MSNLRDLVNESLKRNEIVMHQNGFYQLPLINAARLHIWPSEKQKSQKNYNGMHNHRFSFKSLILLGSLVHKEYNLLYNGNGRYQVYEIVPKDELSGQFQPTNQFVDVKETRKLILKSGNEYFFEKGLFHESINEKNILTATIMRKTSVDDNIAVKVIGVRDFDSEDNDFSRVSIDKDKAMFYLDEVLNQTKPEILLKAYSFVVN